MYHQVWRVCEAWFRTCCGITRHLNMLPPNTSTKFPTKSEASVSKGGLPKQTSGSVSRSGWWGGRNFGMAVQQGHLQEQGVQLDQNRGRAETWVVQLTQAGIELGTSYIENLQDTFPDHRAFFSGAGGWRAHFGSLRQVEEGRVRHGIRKLSGVASSSRAKTNNSMQKNCRLCDNQTPTLQATASRTRNTSLLPS